MNAENTTKIEHKRSRKRKVDDINTDNYNKKNRNSQENVIQKKQGERKRTKFTEQKTGNSLKEIEEVSNTSVDEDISTKETNENAKKKPSKRQLKKEKASQKEAQKRHASKVNAMKKALSYVSKWKYSRSEWKFEKIRQIWLIDHILDEKAISDTIFPIVLEYFGGCKGMAREMLHRKGMTDIKKVEEEEDEENRNELMKSITYKRARQLLQALPSES